MESQIQAAICNYLTLKRYFFVRLNNIPATYQDRRTGQLRFRKMGKFAMPGLADILVINVRREGRAIFLEVKTSTGRPSADQIEFGRNAEAAGAEYHVVRSIDDVEALGL